MPATGHRYLCCLRALKGGDYQEAINIRREDLDEKNRTVYIRSRGKSVKVSNELMKNMVAACSSTEYVPQTDSYRHTIALIPSDLVIKAKQGAMDDVSDRRKGRRFSDAVRRSLRNIGVSDDVTPASIFKSGIIQMIADGAAKEGVTPLQWTERHVYDIKDRFGFDVRNMGVARFCNDYFKENGT